MNTVIGNSFPGHKGVPGQRGGSAPREGGGESSEPKQPTQPATPPIQSAVSAAVHGGSQHESGEGHGHGEHEGHEATPSKVLGINNEVGHLQHLWHGVGDALFKGGHEAAKATARGAGGVIGGHGHEAALAGGAEHGHEAVIGGHEAAGAEHAGEGTGILGKANMILSAAGGIIGGKISEGVEKSLRLDQAYSRLYQKMKSEHGEEEARTLALGAKAASLGVKTALGVAIAHMGLGFVGKAALAAGTMAASIKGKSRSKATKILRTGAAEGIAAGALGVFGEHVAEAAVDGLAEMTSFSLPGVAYVSLLASHMLGKAYDSFHNYAEAHFPRTLRPSQITGPAARLHHFVAHSTLGKATEKLVHGVHEHLEHITGLHLKGEAQLIKEHGHALGSGLHRFGKAVGSKAKNIGSKLRGSKAVATANNTIGTYLFNAAYGPADTTNPIDGSDLTVQNPAVQHHIALMRDILKTLLSTPQGRQLWQQLNTAEGAQAVMAMMSRPDRHLEMATA